MSQENENISEWCLIESNPCIFYDMLQKMGAKSISVEDVYGLEYFDDYIINKEEININHILSIEEYKNEKEKLEKINEKKSEQRFYNDMCIETKYNKLLKNNTYIYGIIFLFNIGNDYNNDKYIEHNVPENLFFAKQVIPNACATQAILSIVLNKDIELNEEIKNMKNFSKHFDSSMKGLTLSNCNFLRNIHNSYKVPIYIDKEDFYDDKKNTDAFHFVSYIQYDKSVYLLDGLQKGPVLIKNEDTELNKDWIDIVRGDIKKEIERICNSKNEKDNRFNILTVIKDKEYIIQNFINIHRIIRQRTNIKLIGLGENIELTDEINEDDFSFSNLPTIEDLPNDLSELNRILQKSTLEINYLENLLNEQIEMKKLWHKELTFKFFNFYPFIMSSLNLMAKHKLLKESYQKEKLKKSTG
ncbi:deubiquinating/deneddylating enzyme, putative [Plasmodium gallinaceum]|uniref:ubiquitinyl hydrolase 1 n=1 Tax=Plasmodium gallinaceum TaxID=5849 RepID=A0A1J1GYX6_PLAGA|nr:deubiquinating/deneddylating enzyme, putative [Plasmodium gallinaceum]CRG96219.1 deubiquinating/deneddylating enzyme, putative [Plasmodium gallinaceum]